MTSIHVYLQIVSWLGLLGSSANPLGDMIMRPIYQTLYLALLLSKIASLSSSMLNSIEESFGEMCSGNDKILSDMQLFGPTFSNTDSTIANMIDEFHIVPSDSERAEHDRTSFSTIYRNDRGSASSSSPIGLSHQRESLFDQCMNSPLEQMSKTTGKLIYQPFYSSSPLLGGKCQFSDFKFSTKRLLGDGAYGIVYKILHIPTGRYFVIKQIKFEADASNFEAFRQEECTHHELRDCPIIVRPYCTMVSKGGAVGFVLEYVRGKELFDLIFEAKKSESDPIVQSFNANLPTKDKVDFAAVAAQLVLTLQYIHSKGFVYRDLKAENVLVTEDGEIRLVDFGLAIRKDKLLDKPEPMGTPLFWSPEMLAGYPYGPAVDWYALGLLIHEMVYRSLPFFVAEGGMFSDEEFARHQEISFSGIKCSEDHANSIPMSLINGLLEVDPELRWGATKDTLSKLKHHPWFDGINWKRMERDAGID